MRLDLGQTLALCDLLDHPSDRFAQGFTEDRATGLADGRQACVSPLLRTVVPQLTHQSAVRQEYEIHVPCLALAAPELTRAHAQMLLPVPMEGLSSCPALAIDLENAMHFPIRPIGNEHLARFGILLPVPQHNDPYRVFDAGNADTLAEIPLDFAVGGGLLATQWPKLGLDPLAGFGVLPIHRDGPIKLQVADIVPTLALDMVEDFGSGEIAVEVSSQ